MNQMTITNTTVFNPLNIFSQICFFLLLFINSLLHNAINALDCPAPVVKVFISLGKKESYKQVLVNPVSFSYNVSKKVY